MSIEARPAIPPLSWWGRFTIRMFRSKLWQRIFAEAMGDVIQAGAATMHQALRQQIREREMVQNSLEIVGKERAVDEVKKGKVLKFSKTYKDVRPGA